MVKRLKLMGCGKSIQDYVVTPDQLWLDGIANADGTIFSVQIVNSERFTEITGEPTPATPVTAKTYAEHGYLYFKMFDEKPSGVCGAFKGVKSVNELELASKDMSNIKECVDVMSSTTNPIVLLNEDGQHLGFRTLRDMEKSVRGRFKKMRG